MHCDSFFSKGKSHLVCQDYAYSGIIDGGNQVVVVSDGCSAAKDTDFGSRFLVRSAVICGSNLRHLDFQSNIFGEALIRSSIRYAYQFGVGMLLSPTSLDATLLYAESDGESVKATISGDGVVFGLRRDGIVDVFNFEYPSGGPFYPSYLLDEKRFGHYKEEFSANRTVSVQSVHIETGNEKDTSNLTIPYLGSYENQTNAVIQFDVNAYSYIGISSDGILTVGKPLIDVVIDLLSFKNNTGQFVTRRVKRFLKNCTKENIYPTDDISVSVICLEE
jgi:hypothetical protein